MLLLSMLLGVRLYGLLGVASRVDGVTAGRMRMVCCLLVMSGIIVFGGFLVMASRVRMMLGRFLMMFGSFLGHPHSSIAHTCSTKQRQSCSIAASSKI
jgi:hypothetical protein